MVDKHDLIGQSDAKLGIKGMASGNMKTLPFPVGKPPNPADELSSNGRGEAEALRDVVCRLEEGIVLGQLHPRERLVEDDLVRKALADLEQMGLVERVPNRGAQVRSYAPDEIEELYVLRDLLETHAARLVPMPMEKSDLSDIKRIQEKHDEAVESGDLGLVFRTNVAFHDILFSKTKNRYLVEAIKQSALRTHGIRFYCLTDPGYLSQARKEHWLMIEAIEKCDRAALVDLCSRHLLASRACYAKAWSMTVSILLGETRRSKIDVFLP
jgi:DNA-binding GntR family transcriptional regulator